MPFIVTIVNHDCFPDKYNQKTCSWEVLYLLPYTERSGARWKRGGGGGGVAGARRSKVSEEGCMQAVKYIILSGITKSL